MAEEYLRQRAEQQKDKMCPFASPRKHGARVFMRGVPTSAIFIDSSAPYSVEVAVGSDIYDRVDRIRTWLELK